MPVKVSFADGNSTSYLYDAILNLNDGEHLALLIQNDTNKWQYFSVNGYNSKGPTSQEQDKIISDTFINISKNEEYDLITNNCAGAVQRSLNAANIETRSYTTVPGGNRLGYQPTVYLNPYIPSAAFKAIIRNNPQGQLVKKQ